MYIQTLKMLLKIFIIIIQSTTADLFKHYIIFVNDLLMNLVLKFYQKDVVFSYYFNNKYFILELVSYVISIRLKEDFFLLVVVKSFTSSLQFG